MSIARRVTFRCLLGTGAAVLALAGAAPGAWANGTPGGDGWDNGGGYKPGQGAGTVTAADRCEFSVDGTNFHDWVRVDDQNLKPTDDGKVHIKVRAAGDAGLLHRVPRRLPHPRCHLQDLRGAGLPRLRLRPGQAG